MSERRFIGNGMVAVVAAAALVAGCGQKQEQPPPAAPAASPPAAASPAAESTPERQRAAPTLTLTEADADRAVALKVGQVVEFRLTADRVAGFTWIPAHNLLPVMGTDGVPEFETEEGAPESAPGTEVWRFIGRQPGHAHLVFEYRKPFDASAPPSQTITVHFDVE